MSYTPKDIVKFIFDEKLDGDFVVALASHVQGFSIGEIVDKEFKERDGRYRFISKGYNINVELDDEYVTTAIHNKLYISAFISRNNDVYQVHFLVHQYPESMKSRFEEEILNDVIRYMITNTVIALRLDSKDKVKDYIKAGTR